MLHGVSRKYTLHRQFCCVDPEYAQFLDYVCYSRPSNLSWTISKDARCYAAPPTRTTNSSGTSGTTGQTTLFSPCLAQLPSG